MWEFTQVNNPSVVISVAKHSLRTLIALFVWHSTLERNHICVRNVVRGLPVAVVLNAAQGQETKVQKNSLRCTSCGENFHTDSDLKAHKKVHESWKRNISEKLHGAGVMVGENIRVYVIYFSKINLSMCNYYLKKDLLHLQSLRNSIFVNLLKLSWIRNWIYQFMWIQLKYWVASVMIGLLHLEQMVFH